MQPSAKACHLLATYMLLSACSYAPRATVAGTGSVTFSHDKLSPEMHMLVVTANPGVLEVGILWPAETSHSQIDLLLRHAAAPSASCLNLSQIT
jgi:hypothetical protein